MQQQQCRNGRHLIIILVAVIVVIVFVGLMLGVFQLNFDHEAHQLLHDLCRHKHIFHIRIQSKAGMA